MSRRPTKRTLTLLTVALVALGALVMAAHAGQDGRAAGEKRFYRAGEPDRLAWVSAEMATADNGLIDWNALPENVRTSYEEIRTWEAFAIGEIEDGSPVYDPWQSHAIPGFGAYWGPSFYDVAQQRPDGSLDELIDNARYVVEGVVQRREPGFFMDEPMTLLILEVSRIAPPEGDRDLAASHLTPITNELYVAYHSARFTIGGHGFAKGDPSYPPLPEVGDRILFFELTLALDADRLVFRPEADKVLVQPAGGTINAKDYQREWVENHRREVPATIDEVAKKVADQRAFETVRSAGGGS